MAHLRKHTDGHLKKEQGGHLAVVLPCHNCDPCMHGVYYITFAGLAGDFAAFNGTHAVPYRDPICNWMLWFAPSNSFIAFGWNPFFARWDVHLRLYYPSLCALLWLFTGTPDPCDPTGAYHRQPDWCTPWDCVDPDSCPDSAAATCSVSAVP